MLRTTVIQTLARNSRMVTFAAKLMVFAIPFATVSASTASVAMPTAFRADIALTKTVAVFEMPAAVVAFKQGDSNTTLAVQAEQARQLATAKQLTTYQTAAETSVPQAQPSLDQMRAVYAQAGQKFGVPSQVLEAVHQVETGKSWDTSRASYSGAIGPMQFLPSTFRTYCQRTGVGCDITNAQNAIYAAAALLSANYNGSWDTALLQYNHSLAYVRKVKSIANELGANI